MPVVYLFELLLNDISDEEDFASAKKIGDDKGGQCRNEHHGNAADDARNGKGNRDAKKRSALDRHPNPLLH